MRHRANQPGFRHEGMYIARPESIAKMVAGKVAAKEAEVARVMAEESAREQQRTRSERRHSAIPAVKVFRRERKRLARKEAKAFAAAVREWARLEAIRKIENPRRGGRPKKAVACG